MNAKYNVIIFSTASIIALLPLSNFEKCLGMIIWGALIGISMIRISIRELQKKMKEEKALGNVSIPEESEATFANIVKTALTYSGWRKSLLERNMKIHCLAAPSVILAGLLIGINFGQWILTLIIIGEIIAGESMNTVIEDIADRTTRKEDEKIKISKDIAAGAVLLQAFIALYIAYSFFLPKVLIALF